MAAEYDGLGNLIAEYHFTPYSTWMTEPLFQRRNGQVYYYQNDHLGTPQRMVNASGDVVWEARYSAFGEAEIVTETVSNNLRFPGQYFDSETGLHHNYFRDYDPGLGRYVQEDPIGIRGGFNTFLYALNNPILYIDTYGLMPEEVEVEVLQQRTLGEECQYTHFLLSTLKETSTIGVLKNHQKNVRMILMRITKVINGRLIIQLPLDGITEDLSTVIKRGETQELDLSALMMEVR